MVTVSPDPALESGITTVDGWDISYDRFLVSLGAWLDVGPDARSCDPYAGSIYVRIVDMQQPGPQPVRTLYALGRCVFRWQLLSPAAFDFVSGSGLGEESENWMSTRGSDHWIRDRGVVLYVAGTATKFDEKRTFAWSFRQAFDFEACQAVSFRQNESQTLDIRIRSEALFQDRLDDDAGELRFEAYAAADEDGDGEVTLDELAAVRVEGAEFATLADRLYLGLVARVPRLRDEPPCLVGRISGD